VAALTAVAVAVSSYVLASRARIRSAAETAAAQARVLLRFAADTLPDPSTPADIDALTGRLGSRGGFEAVVVSGGRASQTSTISEAATPGGLRRAVERGRVATTQAGTGGERYMVAGGRVQPDGPTLYLWFPLAGVAKDLAQLRTVLTAAAGVLVLASGVVGAVAARSLLGPIRRARDAAREIERGALGTRLPDQGRDELAELARSFNEMAAALERTVGDLKDLESSHRRFVSDVSHELRTPLTALTTAAEVLEGRLGALDGDGRRAAELLVADVRRLGALVEDLMEISRLDAGAASVVWEPVDLAQAVGAALRARGWQERVEATLPGGLATRADPRRLDAIVGNLVGNALEHGEPPVQVEVGERDGSLEIRVSDCGPGLPPDVLPRVFDRFYKADPSRPRSRGSGLGLAIARENARLHGGDITAANRPDGGAVFTATLPRRTEPL
jgi:two-component system sensor histidine kinase MtrB